MGGELALQVEAHLFDFDEEIYGVEARFLLKGFLRDELRFPDLEALKAQIARDALAGRDLLGVRA